VSRVLVTGSSGFIGHHLVAALKAQGHWVRGADKVTNPYGDATDDFILADLTTPLGCYIACRGIDIAFALAADMGGMGYISCHDADILTRNQLISVNTAQAAWQAGVSRYVFTSSACVYPEFLQEDPDPTPLAEDFAYPAQPQDGYGWEKLITERLLAAYHDEGRLDVRIARLHNVYGPEGTWDGGREKAPAALCRKAAQAPDGGGIEVWGDGQQTRSFCYISDCIDGLLRLAESDYPEPLNIGSDRLVTIDELAEMAVAASGKKLGITHVAGPQGVRGRNADLTLCRKVLGWEPRVALEDGMARTYEWVAAQVAKAAA
jgi:GDP-D-mannose 3', 5'-epimerase